MQKNKLTCWNAQVGDIISPKSNHKRLEKVIAVVPFKRDIYLTNYLGKDKSSKTLSADEFNLMNYSLIYREKK